MSEGITCDIGIVNRMIMSFLRRHGYFDALCAFQRESGVSESRLGEDLKYLQKLILDGRWDDAIAYLTPQYSFTLSSNSVTFGPVVKYLFSFITSNIASLSDSSIVCLP